MGKTVAKTYWRMEDASTFSYRSLDKQNLSCKGLWEDPLPFFPAFPRVAFVPSLEEGESTWAHWKPRALGPLGSKKTCPVTPWQLVNLQIVDPRQLKQQFTERVGVFSGSLICHQFGSSFFFGGEVYIRFLQRSRASRMNIYRDGKRDLL